MFAKLAWGNIRKSLGDFSVYFLTVVLGITVFYAFNAVGDLVPEGGTEARKALVLVVSIASYLVTVVLGFLIVYANGFLLRRRKREFGLYMALGMQTRHVALISLIESMVVGGASLAVGVIAGWLLSQGLANLGSHMFNTGFVGVVGFSVPALMGTLAVFGAVFVVSAVYGAVVVSRTKLIDLMAAERRSQTIRLRSLPIASLLFVVAVALITTAYHLLLKVGITPDKPEFMASTVLVCAGTWLLFYSAAGFLLRVGQLAKPLYLRGIRMFTLRQLNARINSATATMAVVSMTLFFAITSVCGGIGITNALNESQKTITPYDATISSGWVVGGAGEVHSTRSDEAVAWARAHDWDMAAVVDAELRAVGQMGLDSLAKRSAQVNLMFSGERPVTFGDVTLSSGKSLTESLRELGLLERAGEMPLSFARLSQVNALLELQGAEQLTLEPGSAAVVCNSGLTSSAWQNAVSSGATVPLGRRDLRLTRMLTASLSNSYVPMNTGTVVVRDDEMPEGMIVAQTVLNLQLHSEAAQAALTEAQETVQGGAAQRDAERVTPWPDYQTVTRHDVEEQGFGIRGVVAFLAIYLGFSLVVSCAGMLAIQQLTEADDNTHRYNLLRKLGVRERAIAGSLGAQVCVYFLFPLIVAVCHTLCAMQAVAVIVRLFGGFDIGATALVATGSFALVYGCYMLVTWLSARSLTRERGLEGQRV
ncbi:ABC transporter permease [Berryella wangjianweii]|uniref:ABC transporter permease n=1 Tax=Berryella wangjianweii TaxID=2734634 RepID=A0A6M8IYV0_9ACTN|nr:ABC transporter permease [Berryella wangjianweii]QKF06890.1 ABC transporter permease [Berryella wangjianweii]